MSTGGGKVALYALANALNVLSQAGIVEAIAIVGFSRAGYLSSRRKAFDSVELPLDKAELILLMSRGGIAAAVNDSQRD
ncbi:hypothetical protein D3C80_1634900 [compost metagenome]